MNEPRIIISGGGTGGHIFPAIAIANEIKRRKPGAKILFVGANGRMEMEKIPLSGYEIKGLNIAGFQRRSIYKNLSLPFKLIGSLLQAYRIVQEFEPLVAVGVGGYASGPVLRAASFAGVPTIIQEQNSFAGITNKILARNAEVICVAYEGMEKFFPAQKLALTGNPVRAEIVNLNIHALRDKAIDYFGLNQSKKCILIVGGSLGAGTLNKSVEANYTQLQDSGVQLLWQTGKAHYEQYKKIMDEVPNIKVLPFIDKMDHAYACADVIISRAGALFISELQILGKPVILVPSPNVTEDHQTHNAMALVDRGAAILIKDGDAKMKLIPAALELLKDETKQKLLGTNIRKMGITDAAEKIVDRILKVCGT